MKQERLLMSIDVTGRERMKQLTIAIDGPAGAGKSTVAQIVAQRLNYTYIDTGAMYRAVAWLVLQQDLNVEDISVTGELAASADIRLCSVDGSQQVFVNGLNVTQAIRSPGVSRLVADVARQPLVREALLTMQRQMAQTGGVVMDGRDIGTHVLPWADLKIFLTASIEERAKRRWLELKATGHNIVLKELQQEIADRDKTDYEREVAPLIQAADAVLIDTTQLSIDGAVAEILRLCEERAAIV